MAAQPDGEMMRASSRVVGALIAAVFMLFAVILAPGWVFVRFQLDVVPAEHGADVVIQTRRGVVPMDFFAFWNAEIFAVSQEGLMADAGCQGFGASTYSWGEGEVIAAFRAPVEVWVGDPDCALEPGKVYLAEATWRFVALGIERRVSARSAPFIAGTP